jgi:hypothetical protein
VVTGVDRQRITRLLHEAGVAVTPGGLGRYPRRTAEDDRLDALMARLYQEQRMPSTQIAVLVGIPDSAVLSRLRTRGAAILTGKPAAAIRALLRASAVPLRPAGGRSPFMRRWRKAGDGELSVRAWLLADGSDGAEQVGEQDDGEHVEQVEVDVTGLYRAHQVRHPLKGADQGPVQVALESRGDRRRVVHGT